MGHAHRRTLFSAMGGLALVIAAIGVYGLKAYDVSRRTREIAIRVALGATTEQVVRLIVLEGARTVLLGLAIGLALALATGKLVAGLLYEVSAYDPAVMTVAALILSAARCSRAICLRGVLPASHPSRGSGSSDHPRQDEEPAHEQVDSMGAQAGLISGDLLALPPSNVPIAR